MEHRRTWLVDLGTRQRRVDVVYETVPGWLSIEVDGVTQVRAWRAWQAAWGGAQVSCRIAGHSMVARLVRAYEPSSVVVGLAVNGAVMPGSDPMPTTTQSRRQTLLAVIGGILTIVIVIYWHDFVGG